MQTKIQLSDTVFSSDLLFGQLTVVCNCCTPLWRAYELPTDSARPVGGPVFESLTAQMPRIEPVTLTTARLLSCSAIQVFNTICSDPTEGGRRRRMALLVISMYTVKQTSTRAYKFEETHICQWLHSVSNWLPPMHKVVVFRAPGRWHFLSASGLRPPSGKRHCLSPNT